VKRYSEFELGASYRAALICGNGFRAYSGCKNICSLCVVYHQFYITFLSFAKKTVAVNSLKIFWKVIFVEHDDFRSEVEMRPFRACAMKNTQYNPNLWQNRRNFRVLKEIRVEEHDSDVRF